MTWVNLYKTEVLRNLLYACCMRRSICSGGFAAECIATQLACWQVSYEGWQKSHQRNFSEHWESMGFFFMGLIHSAILCSYIQSIQSPIWGLGQLGSQPAACAVEPSSLPGPQDFVKQAIVWSFALYGNQLIWNEFRREKIVVLKTLYHRFTKQAQL